MELFVEVEFGLRLIKGVSKELAITEEEQLKQFGGYEVSNCENADVGLHGLWRITRCNIAAKCGTLF